MKLTCIYGILLWHILYVFAIDASKGNKNIMTTANDDDSNNLLEKSNENDTSEMLRAKKKKGKKVNGPSRNCLDLMKQGGMTGIHKIYPCDHLSAKAVDVYCDMDTDGGGWTVIQRRDNYPEQRSFYKTWLEYLVGFGDVAEDFWLGNEIIHCLTRQTSNEIRFDLTDWTNSTRYAKYGFFYIHDEANKFKLVAKEYSGTAGDSLSHHIGQYFSTYDADNDSRGGNCAVTYTGAWWYNNCHYSNLNGLYNSTVFGKGLNWKTWKGYNYSVKKSEMKIRPKE